MHTPDTNHIWSIHFEFPTTRFQNSVGAVMIKLYRRSSTDGGRPAEERVHGHHEVKKTSSKAGEKKDIHVQTKHAALKTPTRMLQNAQDNRRNSIDSGRPAEGPWPSRSVEHLSNS